TVSTDAVLDLPHTPLRLSVYPRPAGQPGCRTRGRDVVDRPPVVRVTHASGSYPVHVEPGLLGRLPALPAESLPKRRLAVITDRTVGRRVSHGLEVPTLVVAPGQASK